MCWLSAILDASGAGATNVAEAVALAKDIASRLGIRFAGFVFYPPD
jgi:D-serine deaminase-like pyridoxal phosphate-dependent protein